MLFKTRFIMVFLESIVFGQMWVIWHFKLIYTSYSLGIGAF